MVCMKRVLTVGAAALVLSGSLVAAAPAMAGERTGRWRRAGGKEVLQRVALRLDGAVMELDKPIDGFFGSSDGLEG